MPTESRDKDGGQRILAVGACSGGRGVIRRSVSSLRVRLLLLLFIAIIPALGLTLYTGTELRRRAVSEAQENALRLVRTARSDQERATQRTRQLLTSLAEAPELGLDPQACRSLVATELKQHLSYANLGSVAPNGDIFCSATPFSGRINVADQPFFQRALQTRSFAVGDYRPSGLTGGPPSFNFGYPILDPTGKVQAVLFAELDLGQLNQSLMDAAMPKGAVFIIVDRKGKILGWYPGPKTWVGRSMPESSVATMLANRQEGLEETAGPDRVLRLYAFSALGDPTNRGDFFLGIGIPTPIAYDIARSTTRNLIGLSLVAVLAFSVTWIGANLLFLKPVNALVATTRRLRAGDLSARTGLRYGRGELDQLAGAFDETAAQLQTHAATLEQRVADRTAQLEVAKTEADRANRAKSDFLSRMSHELRTPLNAVIGFSELLLERVVGDLTAKQEEFIRDVRDSGVHLLTLINDVLDISKIEAGRMELHIAETDVTEVVEAAMTTLRPMIERKHLNLSSTLDPRAPIIRADKVRLKQILYNLLSNAVKFTPEGGQIRIETHLINGDLELAVVDTGPGIAPEEQRKLFQEFVQLETPQPTEFTGTGLGLVLVKRLTELHGGRVRLESEVGKGSRFSIRLPLGLGPVQSPNGPQPILIVDDDPAIQRLFAHYLTEGGYRIEVTGEGQNLVEKVKALRPAAICLDIRLPGVEDWDVLRALKADPETAQIPIVAVTILDDEQRAFTLGAASFLAKPVRREDLLDAVAKVMGGLAVVNPTILVVDDDPYVRTLITPLLEQAGHRTLAASGGQEGIRQAQQYLPNLILLDLTMPDVSGFDVIAALREDIRTRGIPIIVLTSKDLTAKERGFLEQQVQGVSRKGSTLPRTLVEEVSRALTVTPHSAR